MKIIKFRRYRKNNSWGRINGSRGIHKPSENEQMKRFGLILHIYNNIIIFGQIKIKYNPFIFLKLFEK